MCLEPLIRFCLKYLAFIWLRDCFALGKAESSSRHQLLSGAGCSNPLAESKFFLLQACIYPPNDHKDSSTHHTRLTDVCLCSLSSESTALMIILKRKKKKKKRALTPENIPGDPNQAFNRGKIFHKNTFHF